MEKLEAAMNCTSTIAADFQGIHPKDIHGPKVQQGEGEDFEAYLCEVVNLTNVINK